jgi:hypothetical protein
MGGRQSVGAVAEGCEPRNGDPQTEFFLRGTSPDATCPARAGDSRSLFGRIGSFIGGLFGGGDDRDDNVESNRRRDDQRTEQRRQQPEYRVRPPGPAEERASRQASERRSERPSERRSDDQWARDLLNGVEREIAVRRERQRNAIEALQEITNRIEGHLDEDSRDAIEGLLDGALRSVEREARNRSRSEHRRIEEWIKERIRDTRRSGPLDAQSRARIENEVRRALRSWM